MDELNETQEAILIECLQAIAGGDNLEACLARYPHDAQTLRPHLALRAQLLALDLPEPPATAYEAGRQALLERLMNSPSQETERPLIHAFGIRWRRPLIHAFGIRWRRPLMHAFGIRWRRPLMHAFGVRWRLPLMHAFAVRWRLPLADAFTMGGWNRLASPLARVAVVGAVLMLVGGGALGASAAGGFKPSQEVLSAVTGFGPAHEVLAALHIIDDPSEGDAAPADVGPPPDHNTSCYLHVRSLDVGGQSTPNANPLVRLNAHLMHHDALIK